MIYKATTFYDMHLKHIEGGGHTETFDSEYHIKKGNSFRFKNLYGRFLVTSVTIDLKEGFIFLLISPDVS